MSRRASLGRAGPLGNRQDHRAVRGRRSGRSTGTPARSRTGPLLGADVIVEDKGGAGGAIGSETVARATPDGTTILLASMGSHVHQSDAAAARRLRSGEELRSGDDGRRGAVAAGGRRRSRPLDHSRNSSPRPRRKAMTYGSAGPGTTMNIAGEMLNAAAGSQSRACALSRRRARADRPNGRPSRHAQRRFPGAAAAGEGQPGARRWRSMAPSDRRCCRMCRPPRAWPARRGDGKLVRRTSCQPARRRRSRDKLEKALFAVIARADGQGERLAAGGMHGALDSAAFKARLAKDFPYWRDTIKKLGITAE